MVTVREKTNTKEGNMECRGCGANRWTFLGVLGREWYRCRACGWDQAKRESDGEPNDTLDIEEDCVFLEVHDRGFIYG